MEEAKNEVGLLHDGVSSAIHVDGRKMKWVRPIDWLFFSC